MRQLTPFLQTFLEIPDAPGNQNVATMVGKYKPSTRITVEPGWWLNSSSTAPGSVGYWPPDKMPIRWFQREDNSQAEWEIPNLKRVVIDRTLDQDAATMQVDLYNTIMDTGPTMPWYGGPPLGQPGYFTWNRGFSADAQARWSQQPNMWSNILMPNALLRVYQGYGGESLALKGAGGVGAGPALTEGYLIQTGTFLIDTVTVNSGKQGPILTLQCRDMFKLLIDQQIYPPLWPAGLYPVHYNRPWSEQVTTRGYTTQPGGWNVKRCVYARTGNQYWYGPSGCILGHCPGQSVDYNASTFWLSVGNGSPLYPFSVEWIEYDCQEDINGVYVYPWAGGYICWISILEGGVWQADGGHIPYALGGIGRYVDEVSKPFVMNFGTGWDAPQWAALPRRYHAERVRFSFSNLVASPWGPYVYRAGLREAALGDNGGGIGVGPVTSIVQHPGNYADYSDIVRDILLYSGWWLYFPGGSLAPEVWGNLEQTGAPGSGDGGLGPAGAGELDFDFFDKKPPIDVIKTLRDVVGFIFRADAQGAARFETPNWWQSGNFFDDGTSTPIIPVMDERTVMTDLASAASDAPLRSEIIATIQDPAVVPYTGWPLGRFVCGDISQLRGMIKPAMLGPQDGTLTNATTRDMEILAELVGLQIWFQQRQASVTAIFRPDIDIDTQVRVYDRVSSETFIHYVRGVHTEHDLDSGSHVMTLTTNWLGDRNSWAITTDPNSFGFAISQQLQAFLAAVGSQKTSIYRTPATPIFAGVIP